MSRTVTASLLVALALLLLVGCGTGARTVSPGTAFPARTAGPPADQPTSCRVGEPCSSSAPGPSGPKTVTPRPGMAGARARPFESATAQGDGKTIRVVWWSGVEPCTVLDRVDVRETPETVTITLYEGHDPNAGRVACIELAVQKATLVSLQRPLGTRRIVDGAKQP